MVPPECGRVIPENAIAMSAIGQFLKLNRPLLRDSVGSSRRILGNSSQSFEPIGRVAHEIIRMGVANPLSARQEKTPEFQCDAPSAFGFKDRGGMLTKSRASMQKPRHIRLGIPQSCFSSSGTHGS